MRLLGPISVLIVTKILMKKSGVASSQSLLNRRFLLPFLEFKIAAPIAALYEILCFVHLAWPRDPIYNLCECVVLEKNVALKTPFQRAQTFRGIALPTLSGKKRNWLLVYLLGMAPA